MTDHTLAQLVHDRWLAWRTLTAVSQELQRLRRRLVRVPAPRAKLKLFRAQKSIDGAVRHAEGMHLRAQQSGTGAEGAETMRHHGPETTIEQAAALVAAIAAALGPGWRACPPHTNPDGQHYPYHRTPIRHDAGHSIDLTFDGWQNEGRIEVSCNWPKGRDGRELIPHRLEDRPVITLAKTTAPERIARDIERRLLPRYLPIWTAQVERLARETAYEAQNERTIERIISAGLGERSRHGSGGVWLRGNVYADQVTPQGDTLRFESFSCPVDLALQVLELLRKPKPPEEEAEEGDTSDPQDDPPEFTNYQE